MSLRHALLATLTAEPMTGYALVKYFDGSIAFLWNAPHSQIYPELRRMEAEGLLSSETVPRGKVATKRVYFLTAEGVDELRQWARRPMAMPSPRDVWRLRASFFEWGTFATARQQLQAHLEHHTDALRQWERLRSEISHKQVALLRRRLELRPDAEHPAIVAFKEFAFGGEALRAKAEVRWAQEGLRLLDELELAGVRLMGESADATPS